METIFENQYKREKDFFDEYYKWAFLRRHVLVAAYILFLLIFVVGVLSLLLPVYPFILISGQNQFLFILSPLAAWAAGIMRLMKDKKQRYDQDLEMNHGKPVEVKLYVTEDKIDVIQISPEARVVVEFDQIQRIDKTKNLIILRTKSDMAVVFSKSGFTKGTADEFSRFLSDHCAIL